MSAEDVKDGGWWGVAVPPSGLWVCPECDEASPVKDWLEVRQACSDCGDHDGRECPQCGEGFDHVFGAQRLMVMNGEDDE